MRIALLLIFVGMLGACAPLPNSNSRQDTALQQTLLAELGGPLADAQIQRYVNDIGEELLAAIGAPAERFTFTVVDNHMSNAFALPNGDIIVTRRMVAAARDRAELAAVIAHEIAHVTVGHAAALSQRRNQLVQMIRGQRIAGTAVNISRINDGITRQLAAFNRTQEQEADNLAIEYMRAAGIDPTAHLDRLAAYMLEEELDVATGRLPPRALRPSVYDRHPPTAARLAAARALVGAQQSEGRRDRAEHLAQTDGLLWSAREEGFLLRNDVLYDQDGGLSLRVPDGFSVLIEAGRAILIADDMLIVVQQDGPVTGPNSGKTEPTRMGVLDVVLANRSSNARNGAPPSQARLATARSARMEYQFAAITQSQGDAASRLRILDNMLESSRMFTPGGPNAPRPRRLSVVTVSPTDTVARLAARMDVDDAQVERFLLLNGLPAGVPLVPGQQLRLIVE